MDRDYFTVLNLNAQLEVSGFETSKPQIAKRLAGVLAEAVEFVPFYKNLGLTGRDCLHSDPFALLQEFPHLTKKQVMADKNAFVSSRARRIGLYEVTSGGSTGHGISLWRNKRLADVEAAFLDFEWARYGWDRHTSRTVRIGADARRKADEDPVWQERNRLMVSPYHLSEAWLPQIYDEIANFRPEFVHGYPSCVTRLARFVEETGRGPIPLKALLLTSEPVLACDVPLYHAAFACTVSVNYGLTERTNLAFATAPVGQTELVYQLNPLYGFQENYRHQDGRCEIVGTSYWNKVMPLIRYRTGDFGEITGPFIRNLDGRDQEFLVTKSGGKISGLSIVISEYTWTYVSLYQVYQPEPGAIELRVVPRPNCTREILGKICGDQLIRWGGFFDITLRVFEDLPRTKSGKLQLVVREPLADQLQ